MRHPEREPLSMPAHTDSSHCFRAPGKIKAQSPSRTHKYRLEAGCIRTTKTAQSLSLGGSLAIPVLRAPAFHSRRPPCLRLGHSRGAPVMMRAHVSNQRVFQCTPPLHVQSVHLGNETGFCHGGPENVVEVNRQNVQKSFTACRSHLECPQ